MHKAPRIGEFGHPVRLAYLFSRYPIVSQTFCDTEMLALERMGYELELYSIYPPPTSFRHGHAARMKAEIHYAPPSSVLKQGEARAIKEKRWPAALIADHEKRYGPAYKPALRARNALYFADLFQERGIRHFHVHFANRAAHTALFVKAISHIPFSMSTHGQDYMVDLGNFDLLQDICREAEFVANETEFSKGQVAKLAPDSAEKMHRVFNGMELANFPAPTTTTLNPIPRILSVGRLIEFKGFHTLIAACAKLRWRGVPFVCEIIGEGPWRPILEAKIEETGLSDCVHLRGSLPQEEVFTALRNCDVFTLACMADKNGATDVFPTVILEAMASAKPVVSTRLAGVPEQIEDGKNGLLVYPEDEVGLAEALEKVLVSPELRQQFGRAGRERLEREFSVDHTVLALDALFRRHAQNADGRITATAGLAVLQNRWPADDFYTHELLAIGTVVPGYGVLAAEAVGGDIPPVAARELPRYEFVPDGMVLEGEWQQERALARRMEVWRPELGQRLSSEVYLRHARHALYLRRALSRRGVRHLHAQGPEALLTAWILARLCGVTYSATLEGAASPTLPASVVARLLQGAKGVRFEPAKGMRKGETPFGAEKLGEPAPLVVAAKRGKPVDAEWLRALAQWSAAGQVEP